MYQLTVLHNNLAETVNVRVEFFFKKKKKYFPPFSLMEGDSQQNIKNTKIIKIKKHHEKNKNQQ